MPETITYTGTLVVEECWCGIQHAVPQSLVDEQRRQFNRGQQQTPIYCPLGHPWIRSGESETERERKRRERAEARETALRDQLEAAERSARAYKGQATRLRNRAAAGVCPCCTRTFQNLQRHMASQHPTFAEKSDA
ncbi:MAG: hypothetical protein LCI03_20715 [Actinobacteria bacterium]|nr:hypothetical protein [Actinomycetota bacterium]